MKVLVIAEGLLARAGLATLLVEMAEAEIVGQITPSGSLTEDFEVYQPEAAVFDLGYDPQKWLDAITALAAPTVLLLPDAASVYMVSAAIPADLPVALLLRDGDLSRLLPALNAIDVGLVTLDPALAQTFLPAGGTIEEAPPEKLSAREIEVLQLMAGGLTNKAIGLRLGISANTVKYHVNTILSKLDSQSRTEAVVRGGRLGLVML